MSVPITKERDSKEQLFLALAREIAIDHNDIETILEYYQIDLKQWEHIQADARFQQLLEAETTAWNSAVNTEERAKLKAAAMIEQWLPEANARLHATDETLASKTKLAELIARIGSLGTRGANVDGDDGERFSVTINLGADANLKFEKQVTPKVIDLPPTENEYANTSNE